MPVANYRFCIILLFLFTCLNAAGQDIPFRHYQTDDGLSYNTVNCILQDNKGFMWFGTTNGLNRFDGHNFKVFKRRPFDTTAIDNEYINTLHQDKTGAIWVGTHNGLFKYDVETERFTRLNFTFTHWITGITSDREGYLWFICNGDIYKYNLATRQYIIFDADFPYSLICTNTGDIWTSDKFGHVARYDRKANSFVKYDVLKNYPQAGNRQVERIFDTGQKSLLVATTQFGLQLFDMATKTCRPVDLGSAADSNTDVYDIARTGTNEYWIATTNGVFIYNLKDDTARHLLKDELNTQSLSDNFVQSICVDREKGVWLGTNYSGVSYYNRQNTFFQKYVVAGGANFYNTGIVQCIAPASNNKLWICTNNGLYDTDTAGNRLTIHPGGFKNTQAILTGNDKLFIAEGDGGLKWIDAKSGVLLKRFTHFADARGNANGRINCLYRTLNGKIFAGTGSALFVFNPVVKAFELVKALPPKLYVSCLYEDRHGYLWIGTRFSGVFKLDNTAKHARKMGFDFSGTGQFDNTVTSITEDNAGNIWLSSESAGIGCWNPETEKLRFYTTQNGLPSNNTFKLLTDDHNRLWVSTTAGLACLNLVNNDVRVFTVANGLPANRFTANCGYKTADGKLFFGTVKGLVSFDPDRVSMQRTAGPLYITGLQVDYRDIDPQTHNSYLKHSIVGAGELTLPYSHSSVTLDFAELSYIAPKITRYAYKLDGLDTGWTYLNTNRKAYYSRLAPGSYVFRVKASDSVGKWGAEKNLHIHVTPPWWLSNWAYALYFILAAAAIYVVFAYYHKRTAEKNKRLLELLENEKNKELYEAKIDFFTKITHEIRTPLTLIAAPLEKIKEAGSFEDIKGNVKLIDKNTQRLLSLTNQLLDFRKAENSGIKLNFVKTDINNFIEDVWSDFELEAANKNFDITLELPSSPVYAFVDPDAFQKILTNLLHNAVKYAESRIGITLQAVEDKDLIIIISNDGSHIPTSMHERVFEPFYRLKTNARQTGTGIGLALARSLAELHLGQLKLASHPVLNIFTLTLPLEHEIKFDFTPEPEPADNDETQEQLNPVNILVVDDNEEILSFLYNELRADYTIYRAVNGQQALQLVQEHEIQLVISDVMMPVMDGFDLCSHIKNDVTTSHIPVMLLTAKSKIDSKVAGLSLGADVYIEKPFSPAHIKAQIKSLLANRLKTREFFLQSPTTGISVIANSETDDRFLKTLQEVIAANLTNPELDVDNLAGLLNMSRRSLYRKIKAISDISVTEMINVIRLKKAAELLLTDDLKIYEVIDSVGFRSRGAFSRNFIKQFGLGPLEFVKANKVGKSS